MNLATMRDNVEADLDDAGNAIWSTDEIDRAITRALVEYSRVNPLRAVTTIDVTSETREYRPLGGLGAPPRGHGLVALYRRGAGVSP